MNKTVKRLIIILMCVCLSLCVIIPVNGHYDYFLTDDALKYQNSNPKTDIDKELYMEHDDETMQMIIDFFDSH